MTTPWLILALITACGGIGGFVNVFIGDSGLHLPIVEDGIFRPGFLGVIFIGMMAALASWGSIKAAVLLGGTPTPLTFSTSDIANGILTGFGGAKWFKSEIEKDILQKTASVAAGKDGDAGASNAIASASPMAALRIAKNMR